MQVIKDALSAVGDTSFLNMKKIESFLNLHDKKEKDIASMIQNTEEDACVFINLKPVSFEQKMLFGSRIKTDNCYQMSVVKAIQNENGNWVPDENNALVKFLISKKVLAESFFEKSKAEQHPVTICELDNVVIEQKESSFDGKEQYGRMFRSSMNEISERYLDIKQKIKEINEGNISFSKKNIESLVTSINILESRIKAGLKFDLETDSTQFEKDFYEIKKEVQDKILSTIINSDKLIENTSSKENDIEKCRIKSFFDFNNVVGEEASDVVKLLNAYAEKLVSYSEKELRKIVSRMITGFESEAIVKSKETSDMSKGCIEISEISSSGTYLFGENKMSNKIFSINVSFAVETKNDRDRIIICEDFSLMNLWLSSYQMMELMQCSFYGIWVKATLSRFCGKGVHNNGFFKGKETVSIDGSLKTENKQTIIDNISKVKELLDKPATKGSRSEIEEILSSMGDLIENEIEERTEVFNERQAEMMNAYAEKNISEINKVIDKADETNHGFNKIEFVKKLNSTIFLGKK